VGGAVCCRSPLWLLLAPPSAALDPQPLVMMVAPPGLLCSLSRVLLLAPLGVVAPCGAQPVLIAGV
jgi:hypothetical protein